MVYIEFLVILAIVLIFFFSLAWLQFTKWLHKRRYKPENDKSRLGEEKRRRNKAAADETIRIRSTINYVQKPEEPRERTNVSSTAPLLSRDNSSSFRETSNSTRKVNRNPFRRR